MADEVVIGVDLGGTRIRVASLDSKLNILQRDETLTKAHEGLDATMARIKTEIRRVLPTDGTPVAGIGVSAPGALNPETGVVVRPPNLAGWHDVPMGDILRAEFDVPVYIGNDANVAALAEALRGTAVGYKDIIYITVSTGIGGGIIVDGRLLLGKVGLAAEVGHMRILVGDRPSTLELESAGPAMAKKARARIEAGEKSTIRDAVDGDLSKISGKTVGEAAVAGDKLALDVVNSSTRIVGFGVLSLLHIFNPQIVIIGGGVTTGLGDLLFDNVRDVMQTYALDSDYWEELVLTTPDLGEDVSIFGGAALVVTKGGMRRVSDFAEKLGR